LAQVVQPNVLSRAGRGPKPGFASGNLSKIARARLFRSGHVFFINFGQIFLRIFRESSATILAAETVRLSMKLGSRGGILDAHVNAGQIVVMLAHVARGNWPRGLDPIG